MKLSDNGFTAGKDVDVYVVWVPFVRVNNLLRPSHIVSQTQGCDCCQKIISSAGDF